MVTPQVVELDPGRVGSRVVHCKLLAGRAWHSVHVSVGMEGMLHRVCGGGVAFARHLTRCEVNHVKWCCHKWLPAGHTIILWTSIGFSVFQVPSRPYIYLSRYLIC